jgi:hypothetical protein
LPSDAILTSVELRTNKTFFGERATNFFTELANIAVGVELFADRAG